jgi:hypothetical protein
VTNSGHAWSTKEMHSVVVGEPNRVELPGRPSYRWESNVKMEFKEIEK